MRKINVLLAGSALVVLVAASAANAQSEQPEPLTIRVGWVGAPSSLTPVMFAKEGIAQHLGTSYVLEPVYFSASSTIITAFQAGEVDIASMGFSTLPIAVQNAGLTDLRIIADEVRDGYEDGFSLQFMVRDDSGIASIEDLRGRVAATIGRGSGVYIGMMAELRQAGLEEPRDVTVIESPFPTMKELLRDGRVDLAPFTIGFAADPELNEFASPLFTQRDALGPTALSFWAAREEFLAENHDALVDFMEDVLRANEWYLDPANRDEAISLISAELEFPEEQLQAWYGRPGLDFYRPADLRVDVPMLQGNIDTLHEMGFLRDTLDVSQHVDLGVLEEAHARLE